MNKKYRYKYNSPYYFDGIDTEKVAMRIKDKGQKFTTKEVRAMSFDYLNALYKIHALEKKLTRAIGGEVISVDRVPNEKYFIYSRLKRKVGRSSNLRIDKFVSEIEKATKAEIDKHSGYDVHTISGTKEKVERFMTINENVNLAISTAYEIGFKDGKSLLLGLADGSITPQNLNSIESDQEN